MQRRMDAIQSENGERSGRQEGSQQPGQQPGQQQGQQQQQGQGSRQGTAGQQAQNDRGMPSGERTDRQGQRGSIPNPDGEMRELADDSLNPPVAYGGYAADLVRQFDRELQQRLADAEDLRQMANLNETLVENLAEVIDTLEKTRDAANFSRSEQAKLLDEAVESMREVELDLARELQRLKGIEGYFISGDNEAPEEYRKLVEEYYKAIAEGK